MTATNATDRWLDEIVRTWVDKIENEELLAEWVRVINDRINLLKGLRTLSAKQIEAGLVTAKCGDPLYGDKRVRFNAVDERGQQIMRDVVYFWRWHPRAKRLWVSLVQHRTRAPGQRHDLRWMTLNDAVFHQLARTEMHVRRRSQKLNHKGA